MRRVVPPYQQTEETLLAWVRQQRQNPAYELPTLLPFLENQLQLILQNRNQPSGAKRVFRQFFREYALFLMMILGYLEHLNDPSQSLQRVLNQPFVSHYRNGMSLPLFHYILSQAAETMNTPAGMFCAALLYSMLDLYVNPTKTPAKWVRQFLILVLASQMCRLVANQVWDATGFGPALEQRVERQALENFNQNPAVELDHPWAGIAPSM